MQKKQAVYTDNFYDYVCGYTKKGTYDEGMKELEIQFRECNDIDKRKEVSEGTLSEWCCGLIDEDWDAFKGNLSFSHNNGSCVLNGYYGLWNGKRYGYSIYNSVIEASEEIAQFDSFSEITIYKVNGHLEIEQTHHDGTNHFEIYLLNEKGKKAYSRKQEYCTDTDLTNRRYHKAMTKYLDE